MLKRSISVAFRLLSVVSRNKLSKSFWFLYLGVAFTLLLYFLVSGFFYSKMDRFIRNELAVSPHVIVYGGDCEKVREGIVSLKADDGIEDVAECVKIKPMYLVNYHENVIKRIWVLEYSEGVRNVVGNMDIDFESAKRSLNGDCWVEIGNIFSNKGMVDDWNLDISSKCYEEDKRSRWAIVLLSKGLKKDARLPNVGSEAYLFNNFSFSLNRVNHEAGVRVVSGPSMPDIFKSIEEEIGGIVLVPKGFFERYYPDYEDSNLEALLVRYIGVSSVSDLEKNLDGVRRYKKSSHISARFIMINDGAYWSKALNVLDSFGDVSDIVLIFVVYQLFVGVFQFLEMNRGVIAVHRLSGGGDLAVFIYVLLISFLFCWSVVLVGFLLSAPASRLLLLMFQRFEFIVPWDAFLHVLAWASCSAIFMSLVVYYFMFRNEMIVEVSYVNNS